MKQIAIKAIKKAEKIIEEIYKHSDCADPVDREKDPMHSKKTKEWVLKLEPNASAALQIAALAHDIDRAFEKERIKKEDFENYDQYKQAHAKKSAEIICRYLKKADFDPDLIERVKYLVEHHEVGGDPEAETLKEADSLTCFTWDINFLFRQRGPEYTRKKMKFMYDRLSDKARILVDKVAKFEDSEVKKLFKEIKTSA